MVNWGLRESHRRPLADTASTARSVLTASNSTKAVSWEAGREAAVREKEETVERGQFGRRSHSGLPSWSTSKQRNQTACVRFELQRSYQHSIDEFVGWHCSSAFRSTRQWRHGIESILEDRHLAPGINPDGRMRLIATCASRNPRLGESKDES
jgi:hypothetical protein